MTNQCNNAFADKGDLVSKDKLKWIILFSTIHFIISFFTDQLFFDYSILDFSRRVFIIKFGFFPVLIALYWLFFTVVRNLKRQQFVVYIAYFLLNMVVLILVWPGVWVDMSILQPAKNLELQTWHHVLSSFVDIYSAMIVPCIGGVIIVQLAIISLIVVYTVFDVNRWLVHGGWASIAIMLATFLTPASILYNMNNFRSVLYTYVFVIFLWMFYKTVAYGIENLKKQEFILYIALTIISCTWRSEGIIWLLFVLLIGWVYAYRNAENRKRITVFTIVVILGVLLVVLCNKHFSRRDGRDYTIVSTSIRQADELVKAANLDDDSELVGKIDKCLNVDLILDNKDKDGTWLYWHEYDQFVREYNKIDYYQYLMSVIILSCKYPKTLINERLSMFCASVGINPKEQKNIAGDTMMFLEDDLHLNAQNILINDIGGLVVYPIDISVRKNLIYVLSGRNSCGGVTWISYIFMQQWVEILVLIMISIAAIVGKVDNKILVINAGVLVQLVMMFLIAPDPNYYYYLPMTIIGRVELFILFGYICKSFCKKNDHIK